MLERHNDVGEETTNANSGIVHSGYDPLPGTKKAYFNVKGCKMMPKISEELDVPFKKNGSLTIGFNETDLKTLTSLLERAKENNVNAEILNYDKTNEKSKDNLINSIVNTLTELTEINKVKFLVDGTENAEFSGTYTRKAT